MGRGTQKITVKERVLRLRSEKTPEEEKHAHRVALIEQGEPRVRACWNDNLGLDYEDFALEVFDRAFAAIPVLVEPGKFLSYLGAIAFNLARSYGRRPARTTSSDTLDDLGANRGLYYEEDVPNLLLLVVRAHLERLSPRLKQVLTLIFFGEFTTEEIAKLLDITEGAVRMNKTRALRKLRDLLLEDADFLEMEYAERKTVREALQEKRRAKDEATGPAPADEGSSSDPPSEEPFTVSRA